ncbi:MAG TPA: hypothetical protein VFF77_08450 [Holophagaceae bacterium]|nr:hypothetical protein [Holophagaceae bacterium]
MKALLDLFARHRNRETGVWTLGNDPQRTIYLERGLLAFAQSTHPLDKLTTLLVERGKLTQAQMDYALQNLKPGLSIGRNLIELGFITQRDLLEVAKAQVERVVWGAMGNMEEEPRFQAHELDASVVRLSLDTPLTLLVGCLHLRDRERLLELLGPLEQKLHLESRLELNLPPDLAKVTPLLDGERRLLDLAQEAGVEPMRLGAFALFLREMGLARLQFGPPAVLEAPPLQIPLASTALAAPASPLLASIEAAQHPTVDLNHLAGALDALDTAEPLDLSDELPPGLDPEADPELRIRAEISGSVEAPPPAEVPAPKRRGLWWLLLIIVGAGGGYAGWRWTRSVPSLAPVAAAPTPVPESEVLSRAPSPRDLPVASTPSATATQTEPPKVEAPTPEAPKAEPPKPLMGAPQADASASQRWNALHKGDWDTALAQGSVHRVALKGAWTLRLEVACQPDTLTRAVAAFKEPADLFLVPMAMKDGRICRQVCFGHFASEAEAQAAISRLPGLFSEGGSKPRPFQASALPEKQ